VSFVRNLVYLCFHIKSIIWCSHTHRKHLSASVIDLQSFTLLKSTLQKMKSIILVSRNLLQFQWL